jgi:hypothetical protein
VDDRSALRGLARLTVLPGAVLTLMAGLVSPAHASHEAWTEVHPVNATTLEICWYQEDARPAPWTLRMARGTVPPRLKTAPIARVRAGATCHEVDDLAFGVAYTFRIVIDVAGTGREVLPPVTAATRHPGQYVRFLSHTSTVPRTTGPDGPVLVAAAGRRETAALFWRTKGRGAKPFAATLSSRGVWSPPQQIADDFPIFNTPHLTGNQRGDIAVAWGNSFDPDVYRLRPARTRHWTPPTLPFGAAPRDPTASMPGDAIQGLQVDRQGNVHLLLLHGYDEARYVTDTTGEWTSTPIPPPWCPDRGGCSRIPSDLPLMAYDPVSDRLVLVAHHIENRIVEGTTRPVSVMTVADKAATATAFGRAHEVLASSRGEIVPTSLSVRDGRIAITLAGWNGHRGAYLLTGLRPQEMGQPIRVPGTTVRDTGASRSGPSEGAGVPAAAVASRRRVFIAWQRDRLDRPSWDRAQQGIWLSRYVADAAGGSWRFAPARHLTNSAYDRFDSLTVVANRPVIGYRTH